MENTIDFGGKTEGDEAGIEDLTEAKGGGGEKNGLATKEATLDEAERVQVRFFESYRVLCSDVCSRPLLGERGFGL